MELCSRRGHQLGVGRFCTNCGLPVGTAPGWTATDTAERPAVPVATPEPAAVAPPPPALGPPPEVRYPLYADEAGSQVAGSLPPPPAEPLPPSGPTRRGETLRTRAAWLPWAVGAAALLLVAALGVLLLLQPGDDETAADANSGEGSTAEPAPAPTTAPLPSKPPIDIPESDPPTSDEPADVAATATATTPVTASPNRDVEGNQVRYEPFNMLDGVPETTWRMPGDGSGIEVTITLAEATELTQIGLINGYAKTAGELDWYTGNRRLAGVEWVFADGTTVPQSLSEGRRLQVIDIDPVRTETVTLRLLSVSAPGQGPARRDYTAISDVTLVGTPVAGAPT